MRVAHTITPEGYGGQGGPMVTQLTHGGNQATLVYLALYHESAVNVVQRLCRSSRVDVSMMSLR
jgi:hypothetical protein